MQKEWRWRTFGATESHLDPTPNQCASPTDPSLVCQWLTMLLIWPVLSSKAIKAKSSQFWIHWLIRDCPLLEVKGNIWWHLRSRCRLLTKEHLDSSREIALALPIYTITWDILPNWFVPFHSCGSQRQTTPFGCGSTLPLSTKHLHSSRSPSKRQKQHMWNWTTCGTRSWNSNWLDLDRLPYYRPFLILCRMRPFVETQCGRIWSNCAPPARCLLEVFSVCSSRILA